MRSRRFCIIVVTSLWLTIWGFPVLAQEGAVCPNPTAQIVSAQGSVEIKRASTDVWRPAALSDALCPGDAISVGDRSRADVLLLDVDTVLRLDQNTKLTPRGEPESGRSLLDLARGIFHFLSQVPRKLDVRTPFVNAAVEGTEFLVSVERDHAVVTVFQGTVAASNERGSLQLVSGQSALAEAGQAPQLRIIARPRDAVQWAIYYPPVLTGLVEDLPLALREAILARRRGAIAEAFRHLEEVPEPERDAQYLVHRAGLLLAVGRVNEARRDVDRALARSPESGEAHALLTVIAVALARSRDDLGEALRAGRRALELNPRSSAAKIALSYAQQANFELEAARDTLLQAVEAQPNDGLAWARLAELWLSLGYLDKALVAAERAASLAPNLGRTNTILGFAALAQIKTSEAKAAFEKAIALDSANPLPRLGLGLAKIREGALREGRGEIEIAASLDPDNALVRSYLGKAYFEERRSPPAVDQFTLAKELDPKDPTSWFYDAIRKQTENRPVEALQDLQKSIELNDNRAVYRSRLLLDEDLAVRGTSLARAHDDLGFEQLALVEGTKSLSLDPANHSAHRFLSDSYAAQPRHEIARASELLQAQMLQPININPVQPRLPEIDLNILAGAGPAETAFNEFTPLFQRDGHQLVVSGVGGNNETWGDEAVLTGIAGRFSYSVGQFHYQSDGFRVNNDVEHDIYNLFAQAALTPELNLQFEYRRRDSDEGDLRLNFNPDDFSTFNRRRVEQDTPRVGLHYAPSPRSDFLVSLIYTDRTEELDELDAGVALDADSQTKGYDAQVQYLYRADRFNITAGLGNSDLDPDERSVLDLSGLFGGVCPPFFPTCDNVVTITTDPIEQHNAYLYANIAWPNDVIWTFGGSYDSYERDPLEVSQFNPKVGLQWNFTKNARLRLAYMETVKRSLIVNQTLEPTQVAGFNQFFDDINGTQAKRYGVGLDATLTKNLYGGLELSRRDLKLPIIRVGPPPSVVTEDQREDLYRAYLYWTPDPEWAVRAEYQFERFKRKDPLSSPDRPIQVEMMTVPLGVRYFRTEGLGAGFFAELVATYVYQKVDLTSTFDRSRDDFILIDAAVGYRLPRRRGILSLEVRNLLDEEFLFQDMNIQLAEPSNPRFIPDRTILLRLTLNF